VKKIPEANKREHSNENLNEFAKLSVMPVFEFVSPDDLTARSKMFLDFK